MDQVTYWCGWLGGISLALCSIPEFITTMKSGRCNVPWRLLFFWWLGEVLISIPCIYNIETLDRYFLFNYGINVMTTTYMLSVKVRTRGQI